MARSIVATAICCAILFMVIAPISDAKQGYAIVANREKAVGGAGHVGVAFQNPDGTWTAGAIENRGGLPYIAKGEKHPSGEPANDAWLMENKPLNEILNRFVIEDYNRIKFVSVGDAHADNAYGVIQGFGDRGYNILSFNHCLKGTDDVMKAYGATNLPTIIDLDFIPNEYYDAILGTEYLLDTNTHAYKSRDGVQLQSQNFGYPSQHTGTQNIGYPSQGLGTSDWLNSISTWVSAWNGLSLNLNSLLNTVGVVLVLLFGISLIRRNLGVFVVNGVLGLAVLYLSSTHLGIWVNVNAMTLLVCAIGGIPGAVLLIVLQYFYGISF